MLIVSFYAKKEVINLTPHVAKLTLQYLLLHFITSLDKSMGVTHTVSHQAGILHLFWQLFFENMLNDFEISFAELRILHPTFDHVIILDFQSYFWGFSVKITVVLLFKKCSFCYYLWMCLGIGSIFYIPWAVWITAWCLLGTYGVSWDTLAIIEHLYTLQFNVF